MNGRTIVETFWANGYLFIITDATILIVETGVDLFDFPAVPCRWEEIGSSTRNRMLEITGILEDQIIEAGDTTLVSQKDVADISSSY